MAEPAHPPELTEPLGLQCVNYPTDKLSYRAQKFFGEGFTWTCPSCGEQLVLAQGKGSYWYWKRVREIRGE